jgi:hypothetical protein
VKAGPADPGFLDERRAEAQLAGTERGRIAAGAAADDDEVEVAGLFERHAVTMLQIGAGSTEAAPT